MGRFLIVNPDIAPGQGAMNCAQRVAVVNRRFALEGDDLDKLDQRTVLLLDDLVVSGWTLGGEGVLPLALATET